MGLVQDEKGLLSLIGLALSMALGGEETGTNRWANIQTDRAEPLDPKLPTSATTYLPRYPTLKSTYLSTFEY